VKKIRPKRGDHKGRRKKKKRVPSASLLVVLGKRVPDTKKAGGEKKGIRGGKREGPQGDC